MSAGSVIFIKRPALGFVLHQLLFSLLLWGAANGGNLEFSRAGWMHYGCTLPEFLDFTVVADSCYKRECWDKFTVGTYRGPTPNTDLYFTQNILKAPYGIADLGEKPLAEFFDSLTLHVRRSFEIPDTGWRKEMQYVSRHVYAVLTSENRLALFSERNNFVGDCPRLRIFWALSQEPLIRAPWERGNPATMRLVLDVFSGCPNPEFLIRDSSDIASIQAVLKGLEANTASPEFVKTAGLSCREGLGYRGMVLYGVGDQPSLWSSFVPWARICGSLVEHGRPSGSVYYHDEKEALQNLVSKIATDRRLKSEPNTGCGQVLFADLFKRSAPVEEPFPSWVKLVAPEKGVSLSILDLALSEGASPHSMQKTLWAAAGDSGLYFVHYKDYKNPRGPLSFIRRHGTLGDNAVLCVAARKDTLFLGTRDEGVFRSYDYGISWELAVAGLPAGKVLGSYEPVEKILLRGDKVYALIRTGGIYLTTVAGSGWKRLGPGSQQRIASTCFDVKGSEILAGTYSRTVYRSTDAGISWDSLSLPYVINPGGKVPHIYGTSQVFIGEGALLAVVPNDCMACSNPAMISGHVLQSTDRGVTWTPVASPIPFMPRMSLAADGKSIFLGLSNRFTPSDSSNWIPGVHYKSGPGQAWLPLNKGLDGLKVNLLEELGGYLIAVTDSGDVFRIKLADLYDNTAVEEVSRQRGHPSPYILENHGGGLYTLYVNSDKTGLFKMSLRDLNGKLVKRLLPAAATGNKVTFSIHSGVVPAGRYILSVESPDRRFPARSVFIEGNIR